MKIILCLGNHRNIFLNECRDDEKEKKIKEYPYINRDTYGLDFEGMINALKVITGS